MDSNSISTENVLNVEFIELSLPPKESSTLIHDDWISCVEICKESPFILTGSFDGLLRIWNEQGSIIESSVIENSIRAATWVGSDRIIVGDAKSDISIYQVLLRLFSQLLFSLLEMGAWKKNSSAWVIKAP